MALTLADVLALPIMAPASVVAGSDRLQAPVQSVQVSEAPDLGQWRQEDVLVLTHGLSLDHPDQRRQFVAGISDRRGAGLVVQLGRRFTAVPAEMVETAERVHLPLIALHQPVSFTELTEAVHSRLVDGQVVMLQEAGQFTDTLLNILIGRLGAPAIIEALRRVVSGPEGMDLDRALQALACEAARHGDLDLKWRSAAAALLERLLARQIKGEEAVRQAGALGVALENRWCTVLLVAVEGKGEALPGPLQLEPTVRRICQDRGLGVLTWATAERLVLLVSDIAREGLETKVTRAYALMQQQVARQWPGCRVLMGAGSPTVRLEAVHRSHDQADRSLRVQRHPGGRLDTPFFHALGAYRLFASASAEEMAEFAEAELGRLRQYDQEHGTELVKTLRLLLDHNLSALEASRALGVGRQTLYNRQMRIEELLQVSLHNPETRFRLSLALRVWELALQPAGTA